MVQVKVAPITDAKEVSSVVGKFRDKYGAKDVKKYYSKFDVAVLALCADGAPSSLLTSCVSIVRTLLTPVHRAERGQAKPHRLECLCHHGHDGFFT
jgi:hypothetical protein